MLLEQFGGANGELAAAMQYSIQGLNKLPPKVGLIALVGCAIAEQFQRCTVGYRRGLAGRRGSGTTPHGSGPLSAPDDSAAGSEYQCTGPRSRARFLLGLDGCNGVSRLLLRLREFPDLAL